MNDVTVIRGYAIACAEIATLACDAADAARGTMLAAREEVERLKELYLDGKLPRREQCDAATDALIAARLDVATADKRANDLCKSAETAAIFAALVMAGDVAPERVSDAAAAIRAVVGERASEAAA